jgi:hypothetical protein
MIMENNFYSELKSKNDIWRLHIHLVIVAKELEVILKVIVLLMEAMVEGVWLSGQEFKDGNAITVGKLEM